MMFVLAIFIFLILVLGVIACVYIVRKSSHESYEKKIEKLKEQFSKIR